MYRNCEATDLLGFLWKIKPGIHAYITLHEALPYAVPALCYCINNNLAVVLQSHMDPATYMVRANIILTTI